jgi:hypothetical protein
MGLDWVVLDWLGLGWTDELDLTVLAWAKRDWIGMGLIWLCWAIVENFLIQVAMRALNKLLQMQVSQR